MNLLPHLSPLGKLEIVEVYEYYDRPCLFSCRNASGFLFLALWIDQTKNSTIWLYVPMSQRRLEKVRSATIQLRDAFLTSEDGFVYKVTIPSNEEETRVEHILCKNIIDDWLPVVGEFIDFADEPLPILEFQEANSTAS